APPGARPRARGGTRPGGAGGAGRLVRGLDLLARRRAGVPRLVRQPAGAVPPHRRGIRHAGPRARHRRLDRRELGVEGRRAPGGTHPRGTLQRRAGRRDPRRRRDCRSRPRRRPPLVDRRLGKLGSGPRLVTLRRGPTLAGFVALGLFWGAWAAVLPDVQEGVGASKGALGIALFFVAVGSLPAMLFIAGPAVNRFGSRAVG